MTLIHSLIYIRDNIQNKLNILFDPDNDYSNHHENDYIIDNEIKRILDSDDKYSINSLINIVSSNIEVNSVEYWRCKIKHSDNSNSTTISDVINNMSKKFWSYYNYNLNQ